MAAVSLISLPVSCKKAPLHAPHPGTVRSRAYHLISLHPHRLCAARISQRASRRSQVPDLLDAPPLHCPHDYEHKCMNKKKIKRVFRLSHPTFNSAKAR
jgi:hypothetical protein